ncbi:hypothetical protein [Zavarzinella formosa]|uniref:hypothetical protein n=1 Tax=Zavarzinella formosa TaxID=360055 RepID=UPI00030D097A|nr:hypothetical protein [Zavarzinella formosa]
MIRFATLTLLAGMLMLPAAQAADTAVGTWRLSLPVETRNGEITLNLLLMLTEADGKWAGDFLDSAPPLGAEPTMEVTVKDDYVKFSIKFGPNNWSFDGKLQPGGKRIKGTVDLGGQIILAELATSGLKSLTKDRFAVLRESIDNSESPTEYYNALFPVLSQATAKKMKVEEVRAYADKANKFAEAYGPRWQRTVAFRMADVLAGQEAFSAIAVEQAKQGERMLTRTDDISTQLKTLDTLARVFRKAGKEADAKGVDDRISKLEPRDYAEYAKTNPPFKPEEYKGRKAKRDRVVLVENFTGAECPQCVAVDLAFDSLVRTYKPTDVVLLQYHVHIPGPDPMTTKDSMERLISYVKRDDKMSAPQMYISGKMDPTGGGPQAKMSKLKYQAYRETIEEMLEKPATAKLNLSVTSAGNVLTIKGTVADLEKPGEKMSLRFAVAEDRVRYAGGNGIRYHHAVVRTMPGGSKGFPVTTKSLEKTLTVNLADLRVAQNKYLDEFTAEMEKAGNEISFPERPLGLKNLKIVAFVQNDETNEIVQAVQTDVEPAKE